MESSREWSPMTRRTKQSRYSWRHLGWPLSLTRAFQFSSSERLRPHRYPTWSIPSCTALPARGLRPILKESFALLSMKWILLLSDWRWIFRSTNRHQRPWYPVGPEAVQWNRALSGKQRGGTCREDLLWGPPSWAFRTILLSSAWSSSDFSSYVGIEVKLAFVKSNLTLLL